MARLSREKKREQEQAAHAADRAAVPIDVRVPAAGAGQGGASVGGVPVTAAPGEEIQQAVLNHLHRVARASGRAVLATVHDERIGYVLPLRVDPDGSSHFTAQPVPTAREQRDGAPAREPAPVRDAVPVRDAAPTFPLLPLRGVPESAGAVPPGTVAPPTGVFGPPPVMGARPEPAPDTGRPEVPASRPGPTGRIAVTDPVPVPGSAPDAGRPEVPASRPGPTGRAAGADPVPGPTPPRGFDAVAEAVLGDEPLTAPGDATTPALLAEPMARVNDAVRTGRIDTAARLARQTVAEASETLGPEHPEVLRLRELTAYIAYLAGEPLNAFRLSLDLAVIHRRAGDAEAAYGNVRSAATAWRAVRDAELGLELGHELIGLWTELTAEDGPAADEIEELESARARMGRLTARARQG
ncbi:tetratricopeptide repeat protein [Streptomyces viridosporus]|uniref:tetratricopeptide repeat protein n=1 Tax=Streptomyces viridosporus TaxID=67581 RepID=UPI0036F58655